MTFDKALESHKQKMSERETELLADKMFDELGLIKRVEQNAIWYIDDLGLDSVVFFLKTKYHDIEINNIHTDSIKIHLAVHQKLKELGWI